MADPPEFLGFVRYVWFSITEPGFEPTQWADSLIRNLADLEFSNSLRGLQDHCLDYVLILRCAE
jgi:hypothetical protein